MKILIITYSREVNPGTFLQAYGVQYAFKQMYPSAQIDLIRHRRGHSVLKESKAQGGKTSKVAFVKAKLRAIPRRLKYEWAYKTKFHLTKEEFDFFSYNETEFKRFAEQYDLIVVGSDTILIQLEREGKIGLMWLKDVNTRKLLFAASAAPANYEISDSRKKDLLESFSSFELLGVRDRVTRRLLAEKIGLGEKVYMQYDPTYLIPEECFHLPQHIVGKLEKVRKDRKIALVNFSVTGCPFKKELTDFLKQEGYYTVSTLYNDYADMNLMSLSPFEWGALFKYIDLSVTERFHDSVFTLRHGKPVVAVDWASFRFSSDGFSKTQDLLRLYGLEENHFIATNLVEAKAVMDYVKSIDFEKQKSVICAHNKEIYSEYEKIMSKIISVIAPEKVAKIRLGGGKWLKSIIRKTWVYQWKEKRQEERLAALRAPYLDKLKERFGNETSIICSNCFAGRIMQDIGMQYNTPTLGLYFWAPDYIEFLQHLEYYLKEAKIEFVEHSKYPLGDERRAKWKHWYPIGLLGSKVEVHFLHYHSEKEAAEKWYRRASRVHFDNLFIIGMEQNLCTEKEIRAFDRLPFKDKIFFSSKNLPDVKSNCFVAEFEKKGEIGDPYKMGHVLYRQLVKRLE